MLIRFLLAIICICDATAGAAAWTSLAPVKMSLSLNLAPYFPGSLTIEELTLAYPDSISANGIIITDSAARPWLTVDSVLIHLTNGNITNARFTIENPHLLLYFRDQELDINFPPATPSAPSDWLTYLAQIKPAQAVWRNFALTLVSEPNHQTSIYGINACLVPTDSQFAFFASLDPNTVLGPAHRGDLSCIIDPCTAQIDYQFNALIAATPDQSSVIFHAIDSDWIRAIQGLISLDSRVSGCADDYVSLLPIGSGTVKNAILYTANDEILCEKFAATISILPRRLLIEQIYTTMFGGLANGEFFYTNPPDNIGVYGGFFRFRDLSLARFDQVFDHRSVHSGRASFTMRFTRRSRQPQSLEAVAAVHITDADLGNVPVIVSLFDFLNLKKADPFAFSNAIALFNLKGTLLNFETARLSSHLAAIEFEKGLTVDYKSKLVSGHAIFVPFDALNRTLVRIPLFGRFVTLTNQVSRMRIQGYWDQPAAKIISKDILTDFSQSTWDFLRGSSRTGGKIPISAFESLEKLPE